MQSFLATLGPKILKEGQPDFNEYRDCLLREADRRLLLATVNFRRAHDMMLSSASAWAHVTLYYASFFASSALLATFGTWVEYPNAVVFPTKVVPGQQEFTVLGKAGVKKQVTHGGGHRGFWDLYYQLAGSLALWIPAHLGPAIQPINNLVVWQVESRNEVNYESKAATDAIQAFQTSFSKSTFPGSLTGNLATQFKIAGETIELAHWASRATGLESDALSKLPPQGKNAARFRNVLRAAAAKIPTATLGTRFNL